MFKNRNKITIQSRLFLQEIINSEVILAHQNICGISRESNIYIYRERYVYPVIIF